MHNEMQKLSLFFSFRERKLVLLWTNYFSVNKWLPSTKELNCPIQECDVTSDRSLLDKSSGVIMHWRNVDPADLPPECPDSSNSSKNCPLLVLFNKEAPPHTDADKVRNLNNRIHLVASYRKDSRVYAPYGKIVRRSETFEMPGKFMLWGRTYTAAEIFYGSLVASSTLL